LTAQILCNMTLTYNDIEYATMNFFHKISQRQVMAAGNAA
jgi:hypothetical protein